MIKRYAECLNCKNSFDEEFIPFDEGSSGKMYHQCPFCYSHNLQWGQYIDNPAEAYRKDMDEAYRKRDEKLDDIPY